MSAATGIFFNLRAKVDKVANHSLVSDAEITKLSAYPSYTGDEGLDARISAIETLLGSGEAGETSFAARMTAAETAITTINGNAETAGSIAYAVAAEASRASGVESGLQSAIDTINGNASTAGSIAYAVAAEAAIARAAEQANANAITTLNGNASTVGSVAYAIKDKVDKVAGSSLVADTEITKLAAYPAYATFSSDIDGRISAAAASVFKYKGTKADLATLQAVNTGNAVGDVWHIAAAGTNGTGAEYVCTAVDSQTGVGTWEELGTAVDLTSYYTKSEVQAFTVNGKAIYTSPTLDGSDIALGSGYNAVTGSVLSGIATGSTVDAAIDKIDEVLKGHDTAINTLNGDANTAGSVAAAVAAEAAIARAAEQANASAINTLNGNASTSGSGAYAVAAEASRAGGVEAGLQSAIDTLNGSGTGSVAAAVGAEATRAQAAEAVLAGKLSYEFISATTVKTLEDKLYVVRNAKLTGTLPAGDNIPANVAIRIVVNEAAANLEGEIRLAAGNTTDKLNGVANIPAEGGEPEQVATFPLDGVMDVTFIYDATNHDWLPICTMF